jgi:hypothetical protein
MMQLELIARPSEIKTNLDAVLSARVRQQKQQAYSVAEFLSVCFLKLSSNFSIDFEVIE